MYVKWCFFGGTGKLATSIHFDRLDTTRTACQVPCMDKRRKLNPSKPRYNDLKAALLNLNHTHNPSAIVDSVDDGAADAGEGDLPARRVSLLRLQHPGPLPTAGGDRVCNVNPCSPLALGILARVWYPSLPPPFPCRRTLFGCGICLSSLHGSWPVLCHRVLLSRLPLCTVVTVHVPFPPL